MPRALSKNHPSIRSSKRGLSAHGHDQCLDKRFEHLSIWADRIGVVSHHTGRVSRFFLVIMTMAAWFAISNHCVLGAIEAQAGKPMAHCHGHQPSPAQSPGGDQESPCCKTLRATVATPVKAPEVQPDASLFVYDFVAQIHAFDDRQLEGVSYFSDTGPPGSSTFAELVLQRSILAHAPPSPA